jgi:hypothetical protein
MRRTLTALAAGSLLLASGCGGASHAARKASSDTSPAASRATWAAQTQRLCTEKKAAIAALGNVNITYAGIARVGLPAVKRLLDSYLGRLQLVLSAFSQRQRTIATPASVAAAMARATQLDVKSQLVTSDLRAQVAHVTTAAQLSGAFRGWLNSLQVLAAQGESLAKQLDLPGCESAS